MVMLGEDAEHAQQSNQAEEAPVLPGLRRERRGEDDDGEVEHVARSHLRRSGTTLSITTASPKKVSQVTQLRIVAIVSYGSPKSDSWITRIGIVSSAATTTGHSRRS
jgi:hypothetical protein